MRFVLFLMCAVGLAACSAYPVSNPATEPLTAVALAPPATATPPAEARAYAAIVIDARSGKVLHEHDADGRRYPASLAKMMTLYLLFDALEEGRVSPRTPLPVSASAASRPSVKLNLKAGEVITVDTAARALAVRSANDVAVVVAEYLAGSEPEFARRMTRTARSLGMSRTTFRNASGLPDAGQVTTARDMAILGIALKRRFPRWFRYFATEEFRYDGRVYKNTNKLLTEVSGMNGIKTGYIRASGYNLVASVERRGRDIIAVVIGGRSGTDRNRRMEALIDAHLPDASGGGLFGRGIFGLAVDDVRPAVAAD